MHDHKIKAACGGLICLGDIWGETLQKLTHLAEMMSNDLPAKTNIVGGKTIFRRFFSRGVSLFSPDFE